MILLVEDDVAIGSSVAQGLSARGMQVRWLRRARDLFEQVGSGEVRVIILDIGLSDGDGLDLCQRLRAGGHSLPIMMLTARSSLDDRIDGFEAGADDYLCKPFAFAELAARVTVLARRAEQLLPPPVVFGPLSADLAKGRVLWHGAALAMEPKALALLLELTAKRGALVSRQTLIDVIWGENSDITANTLDVTISVLRRRLAEMVPDVAVQSIKGQGVRLAHALIP